MHELSIALSLLDIAAAEADRLGQTPCAIRIKLGAMSGVVKEALLSAYDMARTDSLFSETDLVIENIAAAGWCPQCKCERAVESPQELNCSYCHEPISRLVRGQELELVGLEVYE